PPRTGNIHRLLLFVISVEVEHWAIAGLPLASTDHTKFCCAATCHVIASLLQFDHSCTVVAPLPSLLLGDFHEPIRIVVLWTLPSTVPFAVASAANFCFTPAAFSIFTPTRSS